jgi:hypothetical protein
MFRKFNAVISLGVVLVCVGCNPEPKLETPKLTEPQTYAAKVFGEMTFKYELYGVWGSYYGLGKQMLYGSAFVVNYKNHNYLVTAAHVAILENSQPCYALAEEYRRINNYTGIKYLYDQKYRLGVDGFIPQRIMANIEQDVAVLEMPKEFFLNPDRLIYTLADNKPEIGGKVSVWGYPSTSVQQVQPDMVVVGATLDMITMNHPVDHGMSGGPITNKDGRVVGVVCRRVEDKQTRGTSANTIRKMLEVFDAQSVDYEKVVPIKP